MNKNCILKCIGLMSGTSVDAIDVAICDIKVIGDSKVATENQYEIKEIAFEKVTWSETVRNQIFQCFNTDVKPQSTTSVVQLISHINFMIGKEFANAVISVCKKHSIELDQIDIIGSHGQTLWHNIDNNGKVTDTLQLGDISVISNLTGCTVIGDFRTSDVSTGGQGAPFASIFDSLILLQKNYNQAIQNIGGIGNVTILPSTLQNDKMIKPLSFDTGPGNVLMDWMVCKLSDAKLDYDDKGNLARSGKVIDSILEEMMNSSYFNLTPPKSTGRELFSKEYAESFYEKSKLLGRSDIDILCTFTEFTALSIAQSYWDYSPVRPLHRVYIAGGGCKNDYLLERIQYHCRRLFGTDTIEVWGHDTLGFGSESKEGLLFALLAVLHIHSIDINMKDLTGNQSPHPTGIKLGKLSPGRNILHLLSKVNN
ncbi:hypothetical protein DLAC_00074 [Tieghemostelium lacteum]|uniref:Anhydro-N-acetylmuramic acid kinase n=1 Tax=Tieghemostelium lacteum TaxID=361077 RepID=A0A152A8R6_TIELA|nr:hypothetical protein DLAC_00074 [Tieghemostelium lacteum]|eukprot:KYR02626.1 hypothetical protein DLAC_00074 [Tieghemostelium lacteum]